MDKDNLKTKYDEIMKRIAALRQPLQLEAKEKRIEELQLKFSNAHFWQEASKANKLVQELKNLKTNTRAYQELKARCKDLGELLNLIDAEDEPSLSQISQDFKKLLEELEAIELTALFREELDKSPAILSINAGAGGTEACDWAGMLMRMYIRWAEERGYKVQMVDVLAAEEAGVKNVTLRILGNYAYGYLKAERGVHRLVRISPFDANKRRHTSFASIDVIPEVEEEIQVKLEDKDLHIETYRSSGPGGQHMQKADSAVRITHLPSGIVAQCQNERSQYQNKHTALRILRARLYQLERQKKEEEFARQFSDKKQKIEWGSQIRSYVMQPYSLVKDHRTNFETGNVQAVLDGKLDGFIEAYLKKSNQ